MNPALVSRTVVAEDDLTVTVREVWNTRHPDCPFTLLWTTPPEAGTAARLITSRRKKVDGGKTVPAGTPLGIQ